MTMSVEPRCYPEDEILKRLDNLPRLASLRSISSALSELLNAEHSFTAQIAEIIRRDPSLTSRLLRLVNSVFFGISHKITNIEEAVFYLGLRQIRELALATPVIEDLEAMQADVGVNWRDLWQHSIGTALLVREILHSADVAYEDDTDYLSGLLHKVGKIAMASMFPEEFALLHRVTYQREQDVCAAERHLIGMDHCQIGAHYLRKNKLNDEVIAAVEHYHRPSQAGRYSKTCAAVQLASGLLRANGVPSIEIIDPQKTVIWENSPGWQLLFANQRRQSPLAMASIQHTLQRLPQTLKGMV